MKTFFVWDQAKCCTLRRAADRIRERERGGREGEAGGGDRCIGPGRLTDARWHRASLQ